MGFKMHEHPVYQGSRMLNLLIFVNMIQKESVRRMDLAIILD